MMSKKSPQLRFEGFTDDWEERKLDTIFNKIRNAFVGTATPYYVDAGHFYLESNNIKNGQINRDTEVFINDEFYNKQTDKLLHTGDIVMVQSGHVGHTAVIPQELDGTAAHALIMFTDYKEKTDSFFLNYQFQTYKSKIKLDKITTGNTIKHILSSEMKEFFIDYPSYEEQQKIGSFFKQLDNTITLHQRKLDLLKEQKKGYLQKMFPKNGAKVPELRFAGFADDWEDRKLSSIAERVTRKNKNNESTLPLTISAQDGLVDQNDYFNKQVASRDVTGYFLVKNGEFAYNKSYSNGYPWGAIKRLDKYEMGVLSTLYIVFKPTAINSQFLVSYYETTRWYREVSKNAAEGARNHGLLNISPNDFFNTLLTIPKSAEEQQQIGSFFKQLDDTIALHQRKLDLLKEQKKGFLQKMFV